jgi:hypothetical protein
MATKSKAQRRTTGRSARSDTGSGQRAGLRGGGKRNGLLLAAAPVVGGFLMKKLRNRQSA